MDYYKKYINTNQIGGKNIRIFKKIARVYKDIGLLGVFLNGLRIGFLQISKYFSKSAGWVVTKVPILPTHRELLKRNNIFRNKHIGHRCFIIGNGPSLKKQDLSLLSNEITFSVNAFFKYKNIEKWQPNYYCFVDPLFFSDSIAVRKFYQNVRQKLYSSIFLVPINAKSILENQKLVPEERTYYVEFRGWLREGFNCNIDLTKSIPGVTNVIQLCIIWAMYMGCSPIYLLGLDHDWLSYRGTIEYFHSGVTIDHDPRIEEDLNKIPYKNTLEDVLRLWQGYETISKISSKRGIDIINATEGGFLDVFERMNYKSIFLQNKKQRNTSVKSLNKI